MIVTHVIIHAAVSSDGVLKANKESNIVPQHMLLEIILWRAEGAGDEDVIARLKQRTVPNGYAIHTWQPGTL